MTETVASLSVRVGADTTEARQKLMELERLGSAFGRKITGAFEDAVFSGESFGNTLRSLALDLSRVALRSAVQPFSSAIGDGLAGLLKGVTPFAKGGVVGSPMPKPFAQGGVIAAPVSFPLGGGRTGLAGEAGPEAIMPLARGTDGRLGVRTQGGGAVSVTMHISTPDAESFRRSETQIGAMLSRAVGRGQRNL
ncbi:MULTISPECIES: phage tail tape measure protein [Rhodomicrobium]|uniref:phage tail tape measure protein n=1 Tax=Rhodomicrobium TaxID=1068 RepID=UPI000B4AAB41|nr:MULTISPECIES: phage tail tape measure protein [Rhodomicrobium]